MKPRSALFAAIACGAAAVLLVGVDLAFNVDVTFEALSDGSWLPVASTKMTGPNFARVPACGQDYRLTIHNGMPWSSTQSITFLPNGGPALHQTWTLSAGETRSSEVFHLNHTKADGSALGPGLYMMAVQVGDFYASSYSCPEAKA
jgi:hypothetical protein